MRKVIKTVLIILLLGFLGLDVYLGYQFFSVKSTSDKLEKEIRETRIIIEDLDKQIDEANEKIASLSEEKKAEYTEYLNWQRQNKKLEEVLDRQD